MSLAEQPQSYADEAVQKYGYKQEYRRDLKRFASFAVGFSFISITTGIFTTYGSVLASSGPLGIWTWPIVIVGQLFVALVFAALASRMPIAGYSYQWVSRLANPKVGWLIGWISFVFLLVDVVAVDYAVAATVLPSLFGYTETLGNAWLATAIVILIQMLLIVFSTLWSTRINSAAVGTELVGIIGLTLLLVIVGAIRGLLHADHLFSTGVVPAAGWLTLGKLTSAGPFMLAFLLGAFTIVGFEAAANLAEETQNAHKVVPTAMWTSVVLSGVVGFVFLFVLNLASGNITALTTSATPVADIVTQTLGKVVAATRETTALGAGFMAGLGVGLWSDQAELASLWRESARYSPRPNDETEGRYKQWQRAVERAKGWRRLMLRSRISGRRDAGDASVPSAQHHPPPPLHTGSVVIN